MHSRIPRLTTRRSVIAVLLLALALVVALVLATRGGGYRSGPSSSATTALPQVTAGPREQVPGALGIQTGPGLPQPLVDPHDLRSGGPPPDGIPAIDHPTFQRADQVTWIRPNEPVLAFSLGGEDRAYPVQILIWHEIVNDTVGGTPVAVTFCPLCNSALAFDRHAADRTLSFGTSGKLYNSDLVMYDRQTESLWVQFLGQSVAGVLTGTKLTAYPVQTVAWKDWHTAHPSSWVLSRDTGFTRSYGTNPYPGYDDINSSPFLFKGKADGRYAPMTHIVGLGSDGGAVAVTLDALRRDNVIETRADGQPVVVWLLPGTSSALDTDTVAGGRDIGATGAFSPLVNGRHLHFTLPQPSAGGAPIGDGSGFRDAETGSQWTVLGHATSGPLAGTNLKPVPHVDTFWFAWAAFTPDSRVVDGG